MLIGRMHQLVYFLSVRFSAYQMLPCIFFVRFCQKIVDKNLGEIIKKRATWEELHAFVSQILALLHFLKVGVLNIVVRRRFCVL